MLAPLPFVNRRGPASSSPVHYIFIATRLRRRRRHSRCTRPRARGKKEGDFGSEACTGEYTPPQFVACGFGPCGLRGRVRLGAVEPFPLRVAGRGSTRSEAQICVEAAGSRAVEEGRRAVAEGCRAG